MEVNLIVILVCGIIAMVVGMLWYGPVLFGKAFLKANDWPDWESLSPEEKKIKQKEMSWLYLAQFVFTLLQLYILAHFIQGWTDASGVEVAIWLWLGFIVPTVAGNLIWNMTTPKKRCILFGIIAGYQLVCMIIFGYILSHWT